MKPTDAKKQNILKKMWNTIITFLKKITDMIDRFIQKYRANKFYKGSDKYSMIDFDITDIKSVTNIIVKISKNASNVYSVDDVSGVDFDKAKQIEDDIGLIRRLVKEHQYFHDKPSRYEKITKLKPEFDKIIQDLENANNDFMIVKRNIMTMIDVDFDAKNKNDEYYERIARINKFYDYNLIRSFNEIWHPISIIIKRLNDSMENPLNEDGTK